MSADFLTTLAARTLSLTPVIQPAIASIFAPQSLLEEGKLQMVTERSRSEADGRWEDSFDMQTISSPSSPLFSSSSLVLSANSSGAISRLPYSQILAAAPDTELGQQEQVNRLLSSPTNSQPTPVQSISENLVSPPQPLLNSVTSRQQPDNQKQFGNQQVENSINSELDNTTQTLASSQIVVSEINLVTPQPSSAAYSQLETEKNAMSNDKTHNVYGQPIDVFQQTEDGKLGNANLQTSTPLNVNSQLISNQNAVANPNTQLPVTHEQTNLIPQPATQNIIQRQVDAATPLPSLPLERSETVTPRLEPLIQQTPNQQAFGSQSQEFSHNNEQPNFRQQSSEAERLISTTEISQSESTALQPSGVPTTVAIPLVSPLENQPPFFSQRQDDSIINTAQENTATSGPASESSLSKVSPLSVVPANAVNPVVSPQENQQPFVSQQQDRVGISEITPTVEVLQSELTTSPPSRVPANTAIPLVSPQENQQPFVSQQQDNSGTSQITETVSQSQSTASPQSVFPANTATPVVSPRENQPPFVSQRQDSSEITLQEEVSQSQSTTSPPSVFPANTAIPLAKQQSFVSQRQDDSKTSAITPAKVDTSASNSALEALESQTLKRAADITPSSQRQTTQPTSQVSAAVPKPMTVTPEQQSSASSAFSRQPQANRSTLITPLVDKRMLDSADSSQAWEFQARLPSGKDKYQNAEKVKPLVVMSQQRSLDLENDTQLKNQRETSAVLPPTVQVTIGRIEVRSSPAPTAPKTNNKSTPRQPSVSLQDYLKQRQGGKP